MRTASSRVRLGYAIRRRTRSAAANPTALSTPAANDQEICRVIRSTNAFESLNARYRRAVRACGHLPSELAALKHLYLEDSVAGPDRPGRAR